jgi:hypothetical protein
VPPVNNNNEELPAAPMIAPHPQLLDDTNYDSYNEAESEQPLLLVLDPPTNRSKSPRPVRVRGAPSCYKDFYIPHTFAGMASSVRVPDDPANYAEAIQSPEAAKWKAAIQVEYDSLMKNETWHLVPLPPGRDPVKCKWIYCITTNSDGSVARYKARLVAQGCTQTYGVDYDQNFSLVVKYESIRSVFAIATQQQMYMVQFDIQTAFLHGLIDTIIYMLQPPGFKVSSDNGSLLVCLVLKSLYGFKQSGRIWNHTFHEFFIKFDLEPIDADPSVYISKTEPQLIITLFVDDGLACCSSPAILEELITHMEKHFAITRSSADLYVGLHIRQQEGSIFVHQRHLFATHLCLFWP